MKSMNRKRNGRKKKIMKRGEPMMTQETYEALELDSRVSLIRQLIPLGLHRSPEMNGECS